jgi:hypothetical protein
MHDSVPPIDPKAARIAELASELELSNAKALLSNPEARKEADVVLEKFQTGTLGYKDFKKLPKRVQELYKKLHGFRPASGQELGAKRNVAKRAKRQKQSARKSRRTNRG